MDTSGKTSMAAKAVVALSGGVDSAVAAYLLKNSGYDVTGVIMSIWDNSLPPPPLMRSACFGPDEKRDIRDAEKVCERLGIELRVLDCAGEFRHVVLEYFLREYQQGRTPNPCVFCNRHIKFDLIQRLLRESGLRFDVFATGHYARIIDAGGDGKMLCAAIDRPKDQSYFLYRLTRDQLARTVFPLGEMTKEEVRRIASDRRLPVSDKEESQDFYTGDYRDLLKHLGVDASPGNIVDEHGNVIGTHTGIHNYTIGQRKGLGISSHKPYYVNAINAGRNEVVVGPESARMKRKLIADKLNLLVANLPSTAQAKIRSTHTAAPCVAELFGDSLEAIFNEPQENVTPGQSVVLYDDDVVLGGGVIREAY